MKKDREVEHAITQMTSVDKFIACLMLANNICFRARTPRFYKNEETIRRMCPPKVRQLFNLQNLKRLGVVYAVPKGANLNKLRILRAEGQPCRAKYKPDTRLNKAIQMRQR